MSKFLIELQCQRPGGWLKTKNIKELGMTGNLLSSCTTLETGSGESVIQKLVSVQGDDPFRPTKFCIVLLWSLFMKTTL